MTRPTTKERIRHLVKTHGRARIEAYREYDCKHCISEYRMRRMSANRGVGPYDKIQFRVGTVVQSRYAGGNDYWLVVGHGDTGARLTERGCKACKITDRIVKRWQWIGPESYIRLADYSQD